MCFVRFYVSVLCFGRCVFKLQSNFNISFFFFFFGIDLVLNNNSNNNKKKESQTPRGSSGSVLTFSNPNYDVAEGDIPVEPKGKVWKRMKYDKAQVSESHRAFFSAFIAMIQNNKRKLCIFRRIVFGKNDVLVSIQLRLH